MGSTVASDHKRRRLEEGDRPAILAHLLALEAEGRRQRFHVLRSDEALARYVRGLDLERVILVGALDAEGAVIGLAEAHLDDPVRPASAEVSVSVLAPWRGAGLGRRLVADALEDAFARGAGRAELLFAPGNRPLLRLARALGGRIEVLRGRATVERPLPQAA